MWKMSINPEYKVRLEALAFWGMIGLRQEGRKRQEPELWNDYNLMMQQYLPRVIPVRENSGCISEIYCSI
jgi:hypothetical protein